MAARSPRPASAPRFDPFLGDRDLRHGYQSLQSGAWDEFTNLLEADRAAWLLPSILCSSEAAVETIVFERLIDARPTAQALSLLGGAQARDGWELLDGIAPDAQGGDLTEAFRNQMLEAEATLHKAVLLRPALADPWVHLLATGRALGRGLEELRDRFENIHSRVPFRPDGCRQYIQGLATRGGGADAAMFDFARWIELEAPAESAARVALPLAHIEHGLGPETPLSLTDHLSRAETIMELVRACTASLSAISRRPGPEHLLLLNTYALALTVNSRQTAELVRECFERIDGRPTGYPWSLYEDESPAEVFSEVQQSQLRSAQRYL